MDAPRPRVPKWLRFLRERIPVNLEIFEELSREPIPNHMKNWWYCLGGTPLILFLIQVVTGILLTFYYVPSPTHAWESVRKINEELPFGWWIRSIHHWGANLMVVAVILHMMRVFFTGAYRKPRELNWVVGTGLLFTTFGLGFTGYALVYDQLSYWAATVGINIAQQTPLVGPWIARLLRGGDTVNPTTLTRLFVFHAGALPAIMLALVGMHIFLLRIHGITELDAPPEVQQTPLTVEEDRAGKRRYDPDRYFAFFPDHITTELMVGLFLLTLLTVMAMVFPAPLGEPANPDETPLHIKPEWYFFPVFRWLKMTSLSVGMAGMIAAGALLVFWPFIEGLWQRRRPRSEAAVFVGAGGFILFLSFLLWEALS
ncbi:MAG: cytochrome bc complex cytochrome b subunit [Candidatus Sumerlaeia bacterium]|nr:cytochrome bc complex cytochrome b subunit [Candidatus Sumerlaeia bacterium]